MSITHETRHEAYEASRVDAPRRQLLILNCLRENGGMTADEIADKLGFVDLNAVRPRLTELMMADLVHTTGKRASRRSGKNVSVWEAR